MAVAKKELVEPTPTSVSGLTRGAETFADLMSTGIFSDAPGHELAHDHAVGQILRVLREARKDRRHVYLVGNGGSAAVASHIANDFCNTGGLCATTLHEPAILTCQANDYGYEVAYARCLERSMNCGDLLIAISSSGRSPNIINAVRTAAGLGASVITLTGFDATNPLRRMGHVNFWLQAESYGLVEVGHLFVLHHIADRLAQDGQDSLR